MNLVSLKVFVSKVTLIGTTYYNYVSVAHVCSKFLIV